MPRKKPLRIATFNANSIRSRLPIVLDWLAAHKPDALAIQETKVTDDAFPADAFGEAGWHVVFRGEKSYNGVAVVTRDEPDDVAFGFPSGQDRDETRIARVALGNLTIINTYVPQGRSIESKHYQYKLEWFDRLRAMFADEYKPDQPLVWLGDFNVAPTEIDLHDPKANKKHVCFHEDVRAALAKVMDLGFTDLFRLCHPGEPEQYSFFDYRVRDAVGRNIGWRVDHIMGTAPVAAACTDCRIDKAPRFKDKPSDHTFVIAEIEL